MTIGSALGSDTRVLGSHFYYSLSVTTRELLLLLPFPSCKDLTVPGSSLCCDYETRQCMQSVLRNDQDAACLINAGCFVL